MHFLLVWPTGMPRRFRERLSAFGRSGSGGALRLAVGVDLVEHLPGLQLRNWTRFFDADGFASLEAVVLIMGVILLRTADDLAVQRVLHLPFDLHHDGLVALVGHHRAGQNALRHDVSPYFAAERARSVCTVLMRAIERRTSLTRDGFSSWPVAAWKRRLNASRFSSPSSTASWSSVFALKSSVLAMALNPPGARCRRGGRRPSS